MLDSLSTRIVQVVKDIPRGKVATYGQVARMAGDPRATRQVVWVLRACSESEGLPWQRVINGKGEISLTGEGGEIQRALLQKEGVTFDEHGRVRLAEHQWRG